MKEVPVSRWTGVQRLEPPSHALLLAEARAVFEWASCMFMAPALLTAPRGDGHPVLVLPGFMANDQSTTILRSFLSILGYDIHPWGLGRNYGGLERFRRGISAKLNEIHDTTGRTVSLVGWSLGGVFARDLALRERSKVRSVVTLGSPFSNDITATNARGLYERMSGERIADIRIEEIKALSGDLSLPTTSIYTRTDGIIHWKTSLLEENDYSENIEIALASHVGLGVNAAVLWAVADRLSQKSGIFTKFRRAGPFALAYA